MGLLATFKRRHDAVSLVRLKCAPAGDLIKGAPATGAKAALFIDNADIHTGAFHDVRHLAREAVKCKNWGPICND